jgi:NADH:ubiquinone oxidoreductase subunit F (NADH-binding)/NADH:ubiquinone oxidoreductase subunit E
MISFAHMAVHELLAQFPRERTWLLPALEAVQRAERWLPPEALEAIAAHLRVPASEVWGVASHYPELRLARPGRRLVRVCTGVSCRVRGGLELLHACERRLGLRAGETAADASVTLEELDCAFACAVAPVVEVDHAHRGRVTPAELERALGTPAAHAPAPAAAVAPPPPVLSGTPTARFAALRREAERRRAPARLAVGVGTCGLAVGARETLEALRAEVARRKLPAAVVAAGCDGMCWAAPVVQQLEAGRPVRAWRVTADLVPRFVEHLLASAPYPRLEGAAEFLAPQRRVLLERCGTTDPGDLADAIRGGSYATLARVLAEGAPERVIEEVRAAGLAGRGGAYFQAAAKWAACGAAAGTPKYVIVNGEEGEPGIFKDRHLMEGDPHRLLEAVLLAAYAAGAERGIVYVHGEAELSAARLATAVAQAREWGLVGPRILGADFSLELELRRGAGGFVLGEETALLESLEGRRAMPRTRPPYPVERGLHGKPTVVNNVETLCAVPPIVERGGAWFAALGGGRGTKLFGLSGHVARPGIVEMELGCTLRSLLEDVGGGTATGRTIRAVVLGGPSGSLVHPRQFDAPLVPRGPLSPGTGGVVALDERASVKDAVRTLLAFNTRESCGKCTPCREGTARLLALLEGRVDLPRVEALSEVIQAASLCGLGQAAPLAVLSGLAEFPAEFGIS